MCILDMAVSRLQDLGFPWYSIIKILSLTHVQCLILEMAFLFSDLRSRSQSGRSWTNPAGNFHKTTIALQNILIRRLLYMLLGKKIKWNLIISFDLEYVFKDVTLYN